VRRGLVLLIVGLLLSGAVFSYFTSGFVYVLTSGSADDGPWIERVREAVSAWGAFAPIVYVLVVVIEVVVAPIPGALLYAPGGAIFGGFVGGTLSLLGNVLGAALACLLGNLLGDHILAKQRTTPEFHQYSERLRDRGVWVVLLLRANPLTSSDLVSYAAGIAGVPAWKVAIGTLGMAPLCYMQAYFAEQIFTLIPGWILIVSGVILVAIVLVMVVGARRR
jgi:uncharacterized membrane protein YdjX (TVP38/TMEM64 family)